MADWSLLPHDILANIALKLEEIEDFIYFSNVCHSWNSASLLVKPEWNPRLGVPWLLLAENTKNNPDYGRKVFNPIRKRCYTLKLPQTFGARCWGSSCGWLVIFDLNLNLYLFNPLTQAQISLPPWTTLPFQLEEDDMDEERSEQEVREWNRTFFIVKVIVLQLPNNDLLVMAIHGPSNNVLAFARPGDQAWTHVPFPKEHTFEVFDVMYSAGKIFILYFNRSLAYMEVPNGACSPQPPVHYVEGPGGILDDVPNNTFRLYLVESFGDLFMVLRPKDDIDDDDIMYQTLRFKVFRLNVRRRKWRRVKDLGGAAFFVGDNSSISVRASDISNIRPNCIYFTDDEEQFWNGPVHFGGHDMGVYDMGSKSIETFYQGDDMHSKICTPLLFVPKLS